MGIWRLTLIQVRFPFHSSLWHGTAVHQALLGGHPPWAPSRHVTKFQKARTAIVPCLRYFCYNSWNNSNHRLSFSWRSKERFGMSENNFIDKIVISDTERTHTFTFSLRNTTLRPWPITDLEICYSSAVAHAYLSLFVNVSLKMATGCCGVKRQKVSVPTEKDETENKDRPSSSTNSNNRGHSNHVGNGKVVSIPRNRINGYNHVPDKTQRVVCPEMCYFCFDVLTRRLHSVEMPKTPLKFTDAPL